MRQLLPGYSMYKSKQSVGNKAKKAMSVIMHYIRLILDLKPPGPPCSSQKKTEGMTVVKESELRRKKSPLEKETAIKTRYTLKSGTKRGCALLHEIPRSYYPIGEGVG